MTGQLGHYVVERQLGAGAMGVVFLALDERLDRRVALKLLPAAFAADPERLARFEREARLLAALHHPHVASLFGLEEIDGQRYLVLEYVEGETLADRVARGALDFLEALDLAEQIGRGLAAAHDRGIIHRDLKPGNILVTHDGRAKVVDFGLAKDVTPADLDSDLLPGSSSAADEITRVQSHVADPGRTDPSHDVPHGATALAPTVAVGSGSGSASVGSSDVLATEPGMLLGTAAYMSPEQARGRPVDRRCDVWAFGCVVFEMLTGVRPFRGRTLTETLALVLQKEPDWSLLPRDTPPAVVRLLTRCLKKDPKERLRDLGDAAQELAEVRSGGIELPVASGRRRWLPRGAALVAGIGVVAVIASLGWISMRGEETSPPVRFTYSTPTADVSDILDNNVAVSPDGTSWVYRIVDDEGARLVQRLLDSVEPREIPGTEGGRSPFWSPDGLHLGFVAGADIWRVDPRGDSARLVIEGVEGDLMGSPSWGPDGNIVYAVMANNWTGLYRVSAEGGPAEKLLAVDRFPGYPFLAWPRHLPGDDRLLVLAGAGSDTGRATFLFDPTHGDTLPVAGVTTRSVAAADQLFFGQEGRVLRQAFDSSAGRLMGEPSVVAQSVARNVPTGAASFDASADLLVTIDSYRWRRMQWFSLDGTPGEVLGEPGDLAYPRISAAGDRVVVSRAEDVGLDWDLWVFELERGTSTRVTSTLHREGRPVWSPDGEQVAFYSDVAGPPDIMVRRADPGGEERTVVAEGVTFPSDWSPDGRWIAFHSFPESDIYLASVETGESTPWLVGPGVQTGARFSPAGEDGGDSGGDRIAFTSTELGTAQVFVAPLDDSGRRQRVSVAGGWNPVWSPAGDAILFHDEREIRRVRVDPSSGRVEGLPTVVLRVASPDRIEEFDLMPDGRRILVTLLDEERLRPRTTVQVGWRAELR